jgi:putative hydrolase of the HAD superfamily
MKEGKIKSLFLDIGGIILTNGWDHHARERAIQHFNLKKDEMEQRHHLTFDTYESGKLTLDEYLDRLVFYERRDFNKNDFKAFMFEQSQAFDDVIAFFKGLKDKYHLKLVAVNNEGRELNEFRIKKFKLVTLFDAFLSSCYVHLRKPDSELFGLACDISQTPVNHVLYIDDRNMFVEVALSLGMHAYNWQGLEAGMEYMRSQGFE